MRIETHDLGKKFQKHWVFKGFTYEFKAGNAYAITGANGSGKSTLMQILSGFLPPSNGKVIYFDAEGKPIEEDQYFRHIAFTSPFMELIEEFTLLELINFHFKFKDCIENMEAKALIDRMFLEKSKNKLIKAFSSGMKQRVKLGLAFFSDTPVLFLDEPTTNLDEKGIDWYEKEVGLLDKKRLVLVSSNIKREYEFCDSNINIEDFKI